VVVGVWRLKVLPMAKAPPIHEPKERNRVLLVEVLKKGKRDLRECCCRE
jgi:hypothetical protein